MARITARALAATVMVAAVVSLPSVSRADEVVAVTSGGTDTVHTRTEGSAPDMWKISSGLITFGIFYGAGVGVASESNHQGDRYLYAPIVGPWMDLGDRGRCPVASGSCGAETGNRALLVVDGIFQAIGVISVASGFVFPSRREVTTTTGSVRKGPTLQITPV